jgi:hypothetical protein
MSKLKHLKWTTNIQETKKQPDLNQYMMLEKLKCSTCGDTVFRVKGKYSGKSENLTLTRDGKYITHICRRQKISRQKPGGKRG